MCPRRKRRPAPQPSHAPTGPTPKQEAAQADCTEQLSFASAAAAAARTRYERIRYTAEELMASMRDSPPSEVPFAEIEHLLTEAEREEESGKSAEEFIRTGLADLEQSLRAAYEERHLRFPLPEFLEPFYGRAQQINVAVSGGPGTGKSTFINTVRGLAPKHHGAVRTSSTQQCTMEPTRVEYHVPMHDVTINIWDLPGGGTAEFPAQAYIRDMGLRYFDCVVLFTDRTFLETETIIIGELARYNIPHFLVRNRVDLAIQLALQEAEDNGEDELTRREKEAIEASTLDDIRRSLREIVPAAERVYLIASRLTMQSKWDFQDLKRDIVAAVKDGRNVDITRDCPICFEEYADYGGDAAGSRATAACGHSVCTTCWPQLDACPICRVPVAGLPVPGSFIDLR